MQGLNKRMATMAALLALAAAACNAAADDAARNSLRAYGITTPAEQDAVAQHLGSRYGARIPRGEPQGLSAAVPTLLHLFNGGRGANEDLVRRRDAAPQDGAED